MSEKKDWSGTLTTSKRTFHAWKTCTRLRIRCPHLWAHGYNAVTHQKPPEASYIQRTKNARPETLQRANERPLRVGNVRTVANPRAHACGRPAHNAVAASKAAQSVSTGRKNWFVWKLCNERTSVAARGQRAHCCKSQRPHSCAPGKQRPHTTASLLAQTGPTEKSRQKEHLSKAGNAVPHAGGELARRIRVCPCGCLRPRNRCGRSERKNPDLELSTTTSPDPAQTSGHIHANCVAYHMLPCDCSPDNDAGSLPCPRGAWGFAPMHATNMLAPSRPGLLSDSGHGWQAPKITHRPIQLHFFTFPFLVPFLSQTASFLARLHFGGHHASRASMSMVR
jgi:hypothetical protein